MKDNKLMNYKAIDKVKNETIETYDKEELIKDLDYRSEVYKEAFAFEGKTPTLLYFKGIYYLTVK